MVIEWVVGRRRFVAQKYNCLLLLLLLSFSSGVVIVKMLETRWTDVIAGVGSGSGHFREDIISWLVSFSSCPCNLPFGGH